jgi:hypothetical protein
MPLASPQLQQFVHRVLLDAAGPGPPDCSRLVSAFNSLFERLRKQLEPSFGTVAVTALFARALHVSVSDFPWLAEIVGQNGADGSASAMTRVQGIETDRLANGLATLLANNVGLLNTFLGEDLVRPLVQKAWGAEMSEGSKAINE